MSSEKLAMMINWNTSIEDGKLIAKIALRAFRMIGFDMVDTSMDITALHANGTPLNLTELLGSDDSDFVNEICNIRKHLNTSTGKPIDGFVPQFSMH